MVESKPARVAKVSIARLLRGPAVCQNSPMEQIQVPLGRHDHPPWMSISQNALSPLVCSHCSRTCGEFDMRYPMDKYHFPSHRQADSLTSGTFLPVTQPSCHVSPAQKLPTNHKADIQVLLCFPQSSLLHNILYPLGGTPAVPCPCTDN